MPDEGDFPREAAQDGRPPAPSQAAETGEAAEAAQSWAQEPSDWPLDWSTEVPAAEAAYEEPVAEPEHEPPVSTPSTAPTKRAAAKRAAKKAPAKKAAPKKAAAKKAAPRRAPAAQAAPPPAPEPVVVDPTPLAVLDDAFERPVAPVSTTVVPERRRGVGLALGFTAVTLILAGAAGLGGAAWNESRPDTYASAAVLLIDQEPALTFAPDGGLIAKLGSLRIKYADIVRTTTFAQTLNGRTGLPAGVIHGSLSAQVPPASLLLQVTSTSTDRSVPPQVAQAAAEQLRDDLATSQEAQGVPVKARVTLTVVSPARPAVVTSPSRKRSLQLGGGAFGAVLLGSGLLWDLTRRRHREGHPA